jgi:[glutamine synthetase] adenylyltransferase / [glutamine synthetase]-adenylyl-L-tyrosine phosphorylase
MIFTDREAADKARERLESLTGLNLKSFFESAFQGNPSPDLALTNLERWLRATTSPNLHMEEVVGLPPKGRLLLYLMGASQPIADTLIQNPELVSLVLEPGSARLNLTREGVLSEGRRLLGASSSYTHSLDRLRFLRQKWNLIVVLNDLSGTWPQEKVWAAVSDLSLALIELAVEVVWNHVTGSTAPCPLMVVAFGKLSGRELNYSSDVDLAYVTAENGGPEQEKLIRRFCESLTRAISDRMGRGSLYRVDLRLRPYGSAGPIVQSIRAYENYYDLYAEPWEVQALVRSCPACGPAELQERWHAMRAEVCFKPKVTEMALEQMLSMRERIEEGASESDVKRATGGIRDVEFLTQVYQLLHGHDDPSLQVTPTLEALRALDRLSLLEHAEAVSLIEGYIFLRKLEHRTQLVGDRQTHEVPEAPEARESLAKLMGHATWAELEAEWRAHRQTVQTLYRSKLRPNTATEGPRERIVAALNGIGPAALQWFDVMPQSDAFYDVLLENEGSLRRVRQILTEAPRLVTIFKASVPLTEALLSGEIEEPQDLPRRIRNLKMDAPPRAVANAFSGATAVATVQWLLGNEADLGLLLSDLTDELLRHICRRLLVPFDVIALGSLGNREMAPASDADLLLLVSRKDEHREAEMQAQAFLALVNELHRLGADIKVDLRLRPEGGRGLLVRTYGGFRKYDFDGMEMWERFALGHARLIHGDQEALQVVRDSAYGLPLTPERLGELVRMKRRIETERVKPQHVRRDVKLGLGSLSDIEWLVHLQEMRYPTATDAGASTQMRDRIRALGRAGLANALEVELLLQARKYLSDLRARLNLMGLEDRVPENPDRLLRVANTQGFDDPNEFLSHHEQILEGVRRLYSEALDRLRA